MTTTAQDLSNEILNEIELEALLRFKEDKVAFNAMKKYVLAVVYKHGVIKSGEDYNGNINFALNLAWRATQSSDNAQSDEQLGQSLRAMTYATQLIEGGFREIAEMEKPEKLEEETVNKAE